VPHSNVEMNRTLAQLHPHLEKFTLNVLDASCPGPQILGSTSLLILRTGLCHIPSSSMARRHTSRAVETVNLGLADPKLSTNFRDVAILC
jgi:hypothetical protein